MAKKTRKVKEMPTKKLHWKTRQKMEREAEEKAQKLVLKRLTKAAKQFDPTKEYMERQPVELSVKETPAPLPVDAITALRRELGDLESFVANERSNLNNAINNLVTIKTTIERNAERANVIREAIAKLGG